MYTVLPWDVPLVVSNIPAYHKGHSVSGDCCIQRIINIYIRTSTHISRLLGWLIMHLLIPFSQQEITRLQKQGKSKARVYMHSSLRH